MLKKLRALLFKSNKRDSDKVSVQNRQAETLVEKVDRYTEAITFAEAGLQDYAQELITEEKNEKAKVLVVGNEERFSRRVLDYTVGLAERMGYEIIALNVSPFAEQSSKLLGSYSEKLQEQFRAKCEEWATTLRRTCEEKDIPLTHLVKFGDVDHCIKEVHEEMRRVEFVITEPESCSEDGKVAIPVFCVAS